MKNLYRNMMLVAAAAMSFASCSKDAAEEIAAPVRQTKTITVNADLTRTEFGATREELKWSASDEFGVFTDVDTDKNIPSDTYANAADGNFSFEVDAAATAIYAYYPHNTHSDSRTAVRIEIPHTQTQLEAGKFDGSNMPMTARGTIEGNTVSLKFNPVACVLALNVCGGDPGLNIKSVTFTAKEKCTGYDKNGNDITAAELNYGGYNNDAIVNVAEGVEIPASAAVPATNDEKLNFANQIYLVVAQRAYSDGATFVVTTSDDVTYTFTTKAELDCSHSEFKVINLNLENGEKPAPMVGEWKQVTTLSDITDGTYVIVNDGYYLPSSTTTTSAPVKKSLTDAQVTVENGSLTGTITEAMKWYFTGTNNAMTIQNLEGNYLHANDKGDGVRVNNTSDKWAFEINKTGFAAKGTAGRYVATRAAANDWRSYTDKNYSTYGDSGILYLYKFVSDSEPQPTEPSIAVNAIAEVSAVGVTNEVSTTAFEVRNSTSAAVVKEVDGIVVTSASVESDGLHYTVAPNYSGAAQTGSITLALTDNAAVSNTIEVSQLADVFEVAQTTATCGNAAGEKGKVAIKVTSSYPWTITNDNTSYTVSPMNYDGSHVSGIMEITITPTAANETAEAVTLGSFTITRTTGDTDTNKTKQIEVKQNGASATPDATITISELGYDNQAEISNFTNGNIAFEFDNSGNSNTTKYYTTGGLRCYGGNGFTISSVDGQKIAKIVFDPLNKNKEANKITVNTGEWSDNIATTGNGTGTWTGSANSVTFKVGGSSGHVRIGKIEIYYE